ncbi:MAG: D-alanyl-D-alanine carboxypeptidase [Bordetella sp.]|nr:MAG: D-alanyl-D-alanine carboxypeptidase [Bordetella sp.]
MKNNIFFKNCFVFNFVELFKKIGLIGFVYFVSKYSLAFSAPIEIEEPFIQKILKQSETTPDISEIFSIPIPKITAKSWIVFDVNSEQIIASFNPNIKSEPASLTKIMTAYIVFNELKGKRLTLDQKISISDFAWRTTGSRMFIEPRNSVTVHELTQGMIVQSGNDASVALAEAIEGSESAFVSLMNQEATRLGMHDTCFTNSTGLPDPQNLTTAYDLGKLSISLIKKHSQFFHYYKQKQFTYNNISQFNRNRLLWIDPTIDGMKTGHTNSAGYCLISTAVRGDRRILVVVLGSDSELSRSQESLKLLNWSFQNFSSIPVVNKHQKIANARIWQGKLKEISVGSKNSLWLVIPRGRENDINTIIEYIDPMFAPLKIGQTIGILKFILDDKILQSVPLITLQNVDRNGMYGRLLDSLNRIINKYTSLEFY